MPLVVNALTRGTHPVNKSPKPTKGVLLRNAPLDGAPIVSMQCQHLGQRWQRTLDELEFRLPTQIDPPLLDGFCKNRKNQTIESLACGRKKIQTQKQTQRGSFADST